MAIRVSKPKRRSPTEAPKALERATWLQKQWLAPLLLVLATFAVFAPVCGSEFVAWDDNLNVSKNPSFNPPTLAAIAEFWKRPYLDLYIPVTYTLWGLLAMVAHVSLPDSNGISLNPYVFHAANLLLHMTAALAVYALLLRLVRQRWPALAGAMLFAVHPLQVEPVAWVTGMKDVLSGMLTIVALLQYVCYADERENNLSLSVRRRHYVIALLFFVLAILAKPSAVMFPIAALVLDRWVLRRSWWKIIIAIAPLLLLSGCGMFLARHFQTVMQPADGGRRLLRPLIATDALAFYLCKLVFPWKLGVHYDHSPLTVIRNGWIYFTWIVPAAVAIVGFVFRRKAGWFFPAAALFVVALLPVLGLVPFSFQRYATVADRYAYVAMLGPALALAAALAARKYTSTDDRPLTPTLSPEYRGEGARGALANLVSDKKTGAAVGHQSKKQAQPRRALASRPAIASIVLLAIFAGRSFLQTLVWHDNAMLFHGALETNPRSFLAYNHLAGQLLIERHPGEPPELMLNRLNQARDFSQRAIELAPDIPDGYLTLGMMCDMTNDLAGAVAAFRKAVELQPDKADSLHALGGALAKQGRLGEAEPLLRRAIQVNPRFAQAHLNLGLLLLQKIGPRNEEAFRETELGVRLDESDPRAHVNYATLLAGRGEHDAALAHVRIALQIDPTLPEAILLDRRLRGLGR